MKKIIMPQVGQDIPTATIVEWRKAEGDEVARGDVIVLVESDKATFEVEAEYDGILTSILYDEGAEVDVFDPIAYLDGPDESFGSDDQPAETRTNAATARDGSPNGEQTPDPAAQVPKFAGERSYPGHRPLGRPRSSPAARRLAREHEVDLTTVRGTGHGGRILFADVQEAVEARAEAGSARGGSPDTGDRREIDVDTAIELSGMRKTIAARMVESSQTAPHFYLYVDADMTEAMRWRAMFNAAGGVKVSVTDIVVKAAAAALREMPAFNAFVQADRIVRKAQIHVGVATAVDEGLMVPVIPDADRKSLQEIAHASKKNAEAARRGTMNLDHPGTFTVSSLGMYGVSGFFPIINPPQCAILAVGAVEQRVVPVSGGIGTREMMTLSLAADHRAVDGRAAAEFLNIIKRSLENIEDIASDWIGV